MRRWREGRRDEEEGRRKRRDQEEEKEEYKGKKIREVIPSDPKPDEWKKR